MSHHPERISYCWLHGDEPIPNNVFIVCFECGHVWTRHTLRQAYRREVMRPNGWFPNPLWRRLWMALRVPRAKHIYFCQECVHDF